MDKVCRDFMNHNCNRRNCRFIHDKDLCKFFWKDGKCNKENQCRYSHKVNAALVKLSNDGKQGHKRFKAKNTTDFTPNHDKSAMRILLAPRDMEIYDRSVYPRDVVLVDNLFGNYKDQTIYEKLLEEIKTFEQETEENKKISVFKLWHGDSHFIADDKLGWKNKSSTFDYVIDRIKNYFNMEIKATRFNWYSNSKEWKPYHHDAAAVDPKKAKTQNFTVGVSFGDTREIAFQDVGTNKVVSIPMMNGQTYAFAKDINIEWKHGVPQLPPEKQTENGRISIIAWGYLAHKEFNLNN
jgi:hypothetical protein